MGHSFPEDVSNVWQQTLLLSIFDSDARTLALDTHWKDVGIISRVFRNVLPEVLATAEASAQSSQSSQSAQSSRGQADGARPPLSVNWLDKLSLTSYIPADDPTAPTSVELQYTDSIRYHRVY
eukprot:3799355-Pyramimonas_sp.AAC.2